jgi:putative aldouronate transport system permease protein
VNQVAIQKKRIDLFYIIAIVICVFCALICLYPMYYVFIMSISDPEAVLASQVWFWPKGFYMGSYIAIFQDNAMWRAYGYTILYAVSGTILMLVSSMLVAYPLVKKNLMFRKALVIFLLIPMYFAGGMIPSFLLVYKLGIYNTIWAMILPGYGIWNIILMKTYLKSIPEALPEAATIDGATNMQVLAHIYVPLAKPIMAVISIYTIVGIWNSWFGAQIYLPNSKLHPLQMYLQRVLIAQSVDMSKVLKDVQDADTVRALYLQSLSARQMKYAMIIFATLPILMIYLMFQKHFVKGIMLGSLKG